MAEEDEEEGLGYFDMDITVEPGFIVVKPTGLAKALTEQGTIRLSAADLEQLGIYMLRTAALSLAMDELAGDTEDNDDTSIED